MNELTRSKGNICACALALACAYPCNGTKWVRMIIFHTNCMRWCNILYFMLPLSQLTLPFVWSTFFRSFTTVFCTVFIFLGWCAMCVWLSRQTFPIAWKILWNLFRFTFYSLSPLFFLSFLTRQRVFFSRYNNTTIGFDGFALLLVYVYVGV